MPVPVRNNVFHTNAPEAGIQPIIYETVNESCDDSALVRSALRYKRAHYDFVDQKCVRQISKSLKRKGDAKHPKYMLRGVKGLKYINLNQS